MTRDLHSDGCGAENSADNNIAETPAEMAASIRSAADDGDTIIVHATDGTIIEGVIDMMLADYPLASEAHRSVAPPRGEVDGSFASGYAHEHLDADEASVEVSEAESGGWADAELRWARGPEGDREWFRASVERIEVVNNG